MILFLRLVVALALAFLSGKLVAKLKLPSILGWLLAGMILGPHALSMVSDELLEAAWYEGMIHTLECAVGLMIGTELVWKKIKKSGRSIVITTLTQSLGTFLLVSLVFGAVFYFSGIPLYLSFVFGGIALATAPVPALSIVREFRTRGPVTDTLIPMAALDDIVGCIVFFTTVAVIMGRLSGGELLPLVVGAVVGLPAGLILKKERDAKKNLGILIVFILLAACSGFAVNHFVFKKSILNFMLIGMAFSAVFLI